MKTELVANLKRKAIKNLSELHESKETVLITEHGKPSACLVNFEDYEPLQRRMQILEGIARGESAALKGRVFGHRVAKAKMKKWLS